jgi:WXG100 family type VII secretion target
VSTPPVFDVDLGELRAALAELAACQRDLVGIAAEIDQAQTRLQDGWTGRAADAQVLSYDSWRDGCAEMVTALAGLRAIVSAADESYSRAASANVELWQQVSA